MVVDHLPGNFWLELQKEKNIFQSFSGRKKPHKKTDQVKFPQVGDYQLFGGGVFHGFDHLICPRCAISSKFFRET